MSSDMLGLLFPGWINKSDVNRDFIFLKYHHTIPMMNMWCHDEFELSFASL